MTICKQTQNTTNICNLIPTFLSWNERKRVKERNIKNNTSNNHNKECFSFALRSQKLHVCLVSLHTSLTVSQWILHHTWLCQFMQQPQRTESDNIAVNTTLHLPCEFTQQLITKTTCNRSKSDKITLTEYRVCLSQSTQQLITKTTSKRPESDKSILTEHHVCLSQSTQHVNHKNHM